MISGFLPSMISMIGNSWDCIFKRQSNFGSLNFESIVPPKSWLIWKSSNQSSQDNINHSSLYTKLNQSILGPNNPYFATVCRKKFEPLHQMFSSLLKKHLDYYSRKGRRLNWMNIYYFWFVSNWFNQLKTYSLRLPSDKSK